MPTVTKSRYFGKRVPAVPHLSSGEVADLRSDVEKAFLQQQTEAIGPTASRPASPFTGQVFFDTTLGRNIIWDGTAWSPNKGTTGGLTVATRAALAAISNPGEVALALVTANLGYYLFDPNSTITADGQYVIAPPSGNGRWMRQRWGHDFHRLQANWDVDPVNGSDDNTGIASTSSPLKTFKELAFRLAFLTRTTVVNLLNDLPNTDSIQSLALPAYGEGSGSTGLRITGQMTTSRTGTITTAAQRTGNTSPLVSDSTVSSWTADVGKMLVVTSGAGAGSFCWILLDLGSNTARTTPWANSNGSGNGTLPTAGDTYKIVTLTKITDAQFALPTLAFNSADSVRLINLEITTNFGTSANGFSSSLLNCIGCKFSAQVQVAGRYTFFRGCMFTGTNGFSARNANSTTQINHSGFLFTFQVLDGANAVLNDCVSQSAGGFQAYTGGVVSATRCGAYGATGGAFTAQRGGILNMTDCYGSSNVYGLVVTRGGKAFTGGTMTVTGTTQEVNLESAATAIPPLTAGAAVPAASALTTWAQLAAAPFNGYVLSYSSGASICPG